MRATPAVFASLLFFATAGHGAQNANGAQSKAPQRVAAASICANGTVTGRYFHPSDASWVAFDVALARNAVDEAVTAVRNGCTRYARSDYCQLVSWIDARAGTQDARNARALTVSELARLADMLGAMEWDDAYRALMAREAEARAGF